MTPVWIFALVVTAAPNPPLTSAEDLVAQIRYADAEKQLAIARSLPNNTRDTLLRIIELQGIVAATLGQAPRARTYFQQLLSLDPGRKLQDGLPPRVRTPFYEAKGMEASQMGFTAEVEPTQLRAKLSSDPMTLARKVRFHIRPQGAEWGVTDEPIAAGFAVAPVTVTAYQWFAELLGEQDAILFNVGTEAAARSEGVGAAAAFTPIVTGPSPAARRGVNPAAFVLIGAGGAAAIGGVVAGVLSRGNLDRLNSAARDSNGYVTGLTQRQGEGLKADARTQAIAANVLFGTAVVLVATGAVVWLVSGRSAKVAVLPGPAGVAIAGELF